MADGAELLEKMRLRRHSWRPADFEKIYSYYGFEKEEGRRHTLYTHPDHPDLMATVGRHKLLTPGYATDAVRLITELKKRDTAGEGDNGNEAV